MAKKTLRVPAAQATVLKTIHGILSFLLSPLMAFYDTYLVWPSPSEAKSSFRPKIEYVHLAGGIAALLVTVTLAVLFVLAIGTPAIPAVAALSGLVISVGAFPPVAMAIMIIVLAAVIARSLVSLIAAEIAIIPSLKTSAHAVGPGKEINLTKMRRGIILAGLIGANLKNNLLPPRPQPIRMEEIPSKHRTKTSPVSKSASRITDEGERRPILNSSDRDQKNSQARAASNVAPVASSPSQRGNTSHLLASLSQKPAGSKATSEKRNLLRYLENLAGHLKQEKAKDYSSYSEEEREETKATLEGDSHRIKTFMENFLKDAGEASEENPVYEKLKEMQAQVLIQLEKITSPQPLAAAVTEAQDNNALEADAEERDLARPSGSIGG